MPPSFPQWQCFPQFSAVAAGTLLYPRPVGRSGAALPAYPFPQRQRFPRFGAVAESKCAVRHFGRRCGTSRLVGHRKMQFGRVLTGDSRTGPALSRGCIVRIIRGLYFVLFAGPPAFCRKTGILPVVQQMAFFEHSDYQALLETWLAGLQVLHERLYARQLFRNSGRSTEPRWYS